MKPPCADGTFPLCPEACKDGSDAVLNGNFGKKYTAVVTYINTIKTTFDLNFDLYQAFKQHGYTHKWKRIEVVLGFFGPGVT